MKLIAKVIDPTIDAAYFICRICDSLVVTSEKTLRAEYSSAFARFKQQHRDCLDEFWDSRDKEKFLK